MIRKAIQNDIAAINEIYNHAVAAKFQTASMVEQSLAETKKWFQEHQRERYNIYVYVIDNKVVGWCSFSPYYDREATSHTAEISYYLHKNFQNMGIGTKLMEFIFEKAHEFNFTALFATLISANNASIALLEKFNFKRWGALKNTAKIDNNFYDILYYGINLD